MAFSDCSVLIRDACQTKVVPSNSFGYSRLAVICFKGDGLDRDSILATSPAVNWCILHLREGKNDSIRRFASLVQRGAARMSLMARFWMVSRVTKSWGDRVRRAGAL